MISVPVESRSRQVISTSSGGGSGATFCTLVIVDEMEILCGDSTEFSEGASI